MYWVKTSWTYSVYLGCPQDIGVSLVTLTATQLNGIVAIGHKLLKKFWPFGNGLRSTHYKTIPIHNNMHLSF